MRIVIVEKKVVFMGEVAKAEARYEKEKDKAVEAMGKTKHIQLAEVIKGTII